MMCVYYMRVTHDVCLLYEGHMTCIKVKNYKKINYKFNAFNLIIYQIPLLNFH